MGFQWWRSLTWWSSGRIAPRLECMAMESAGLMPQDKSVLQWDGEGWQGTAGDGEGWQGRWRMAGDGVGWPQYPSQSPLVTRHSFTHHSSSLSALSTQHSTLSTYSISYLYPLRLSPASISCLYPLPLHRQKQASRHRLAAHIKDHKRTLS